MAFGDDVNLSTRWSEQGLPAQRSEADSSFNASALLKGTGRVCTNPPSSRHQGTEENMVNQNPNLNPIVLTLTQCCTLIGMQKTLSDRQSSLEVSSR